MGHICVFIASTYGKQGKILTNGSHMCSGHHHNYVFVVDCRYSLFSQKDEKQTTEDRETLSTSQNNSNQLAAIGTYNENTI